MNDLDRLNFEVGAELEARGGVLDKLDYNHLRQLGVLLRNIPQIRADQDWDFPPASLQGWIKSYTATVQAVRIAAESGLTSLIGVKSDEIRALLSPAIIPSLDIYIVGEERVEEMISHAKDYDRFKNLDFEKLLSQAASNEEIARVVVVMLGEPIRFDERPKVDRDVGMKRLQIGALIGKAAAGGALAVANLSLGALAGLSVLPAIMGNVPVAVAVVGSAYTGLAAACDAVEKIAAVVR